MVEFCEVSPYGQCTEQMRWMYNNQTSPLKSQDLHWESEWVESGTATRVIQTLRDTLWCVDRPHLTLSERGCTVPALFPQFSGYNKPEQHKHRKRILSSLLNFRVHGATITFTGFIHYSYLEEAIMISAERGRQVIIHSGILLQAAEDPIEMIICKVWRHLCLLCFLCTSMEWYSEPHCPQS